MRSYICLGRIGDLLNAAQICFHEHLRTGRYVKLVVAKEFRPVLDGFGYIEPITFDGTQDELSRAMREHPYAIPIQSWANPDQSRQTDSYQKEAWRRAGILEAFGSVPIVVDGRSLAREAEFCAQFPADKPFIIVATKSPSSPFKWGDELFYAVSEAFRDTHTVIPICEYQAHRFYDLLGLLDRAALLIAIDTAHLHLARASTCPVIAIVNDLGTSATPGSWAASVPPPQAVLTYHYGEFTAHGAKFLPDLIAKAAHSILASTAPRIIHAVQMHGSEQRHWNAQETWKGLFQDTTAPANHAMRFWKRTASDIGDARSPPYLKDVLQDAMSKAGDSDIIFWCNSDNALSPELPAFLRKHVPLYGACAFRRAEKETPGTHCGMEGAAFSKSWLVKHWDSIPDYLLGFCMWDIGLRALIRKERGVVTTKANLTTEFHPCDVGEGYIFHESHPSKWAEDEGSPGNRYNRRLFREWSKSNLPHLKFTHDDNLA